MAMSKKQACALAKATRAQGRTPSAKITRKCRGAKSNPARKTTKRKTTKRRKSSAKARKPAARTTKARVVRAVTSRGKSRRVSRHRAPPGQYVSRRTGKKYTFLKNPLNSTKKLAVAGVGLAVGLTAASLLDRYIATMPPKGSDKALVGGAAAAQIQAQPSNTRIAAQGLGTVGSGIGAYLLRRKSPLGSVFLGGMAVGFGVKLFQQLTEGLLMPKVFKAKSSTEATFANRFFPEYQSFGTNGGTAGRPFPRGRARGSLGAPSVPDVGPVAAGSGTVGACSCKAQGGNPFHTNTCERWPWRRAGDTSPSAPGALTVEAATGETPAASPTNSLAQLMRFVPQTVR